MAHLISWKYPNHVINQIEVNFQPTKWLWHRCWLMLSQVFEVYRSQSFSSLSSPQSKKNGKTSNINQSLIYDAIYMEGILSTGFTLKSDILTYWNNQHLPSLKFQRSKIPQTSPSKNSGRSFNGIEGNHFWGGKQGKFLENPIGSMGLYVYLPTNLPSK